MENQIREIFWNIRHQWLFYILSIIAVIIFFFGIHRRVSVWLRGGRRKFTLKILDGIQTFLISGLLSSRIFHKDIYAGLMHLLVMWGFIILFLGAALDAIHHYFFHYLYGRLYLTFSLLLDIAGAMLLVGLAMAVMRRYLFKAHLMNTVWDDGVTLGLLFLVALTGFFVEGLRLAALRPPFSDWSFFGALVASFIDGSVQSTRAAHKVVWWIHAPLSLGLVAYIPYSKLFHIFSSSLNLYISPQKEDFLIAEERAALKEEFSLRNLIAYDACTRCNRCENVCPSFACREPFSPRDVVQRLKRYASCRMKQDRAFTALWKIHEDTLKIWEAEIAELSWFCTTCLHCVRECPVLIEIPDLVREVRCQEIEEGRRVPETVQEALESAAKYGNPWGFPKNKRASWAKDMDLKDLSKGGRVEILYFVGCVPSYDERCQAVARSFVFMMQKAGFDTGFLGNHERCCGDFARRLGEDGLFEELASENIARICASGAVTVVTTQPHCFHVLGNEYPPLKEKLKLQGNMPEVRHATGLIIDLLQKKKIEFKGEIRKKAVFHDPCYLGRHNGIYTAPREILRAIPGIKLLEMRRHGRESFCCGGGGGRMWLESSAEERMAQIRLQEAVETAAEILVTACPFCLQNLEDAVKTAGLEGSLEVRDVVELAAEALEPQ